MKERKASLNFPQQFEFINIDLWEIWHFDVKGTGWVGLQLSVILTQTVGRLDM